MSNSRPPKNLILTGFMGSGKTTVGRVLARRLGWRFRDLDREIERRAGMSVPAIFRRRGEAAFREMEHRAIRTLSSRTGEVIAVGGGAPAFERNRKWLEKAGMTIWLDVPASELIRRLRAGRGRPLLGPAAGGRRAMARLVTGLLARRRRAYSRARIRLRAGRRSPDRVAAAIAERSGLGGCGR